jgi:hypothetical protein
VCNKTTIAAASLLAGAAEALTRKVVEFAMGGPCHRQAALLRTHVAAVPRALGQLALPPIESVVVIAAAMTAVTSALAGGMITRGEAARIAAVGDA